jgi:hypothetical protein
MMRGRFGKLPTLLGGSGRRKSSQLKSIFTYSQLAEWLTRFADWQESQNDN